jgi:hypothetical protein
LVIFLYWHSWLPALAFCHVVVVAISSLFSSYLGFSCRIIVPASSPLSDQLYFKGLGLTLAIAFACGHSIPHPYLPYISHISSCKHTMTQARLGCSNMGTPAFITEFGDCDKCTKSKLAREYVEIVTLNPALQMQELSRKRKEKSLPQFDVEGASKKPLETKRMLPSRFNGPKVLDGGHLAPPINLATKPKMMSANMRQKLSEHKMDGSSDEVEDGDWVFVNAE